MQKNRKFWFTLVEVVIACSIFAIIVVWIILAINRSFAFMNNTKLSIRATNFAREWVELMYTIRDTNWRRQSWNRDSYWLNRGTLDANGKLSPGNDIAKWIYVLKEWEIKDHNTVLNKYIYVDKINLPVDDAVFYSDDGFWDANSSYRDQARLGFNWTYSYYELTGATPERKEMTGYINDLLVESGLEFYRIVRVYWIYCKNTASCPNPSDPKEMRFCVKVFYRWNWKHSKELCSIMTNFME